MTARRSFTRACAIGAAIGALLFAWMLTRGTFDFFQWQRVGDFYDAQAHSFLSGHLSIDGRLLGVEAFTVNGNAYMYQGPIPALMRLPIIALAGHALDGRLSQLSLMAAFVVALVFACRLHWQIRRRVRGDVPVSGTEAFLVGLFTFVLAGGSCLLYEASRAWVYHEALTWGAAFALASIDQMLSFAERPSRRALVLCSGFAACALLTRASIGVGPVVGIGLLWLGVLARELRGRLGERRRDPLRRLLWLAPADDDASPVEATPERTRTRSPYRVWLGVATLAPLAAYAIVNFAKFHRLFSVPFYAQTFSRVDPGRQRFLAEHGGTLFGVEFVPTTLLQYLRPDALRFTSLFPFVDFADFPGRVIGGVSFDLFDRSSSLTASLPFLFALALGGLWFLFRRRSWRSEPRLRALRVPTIAAVAAACTILPFGYIANRYLADFLPVLVIGGALGLQVLIRRLGESPRRSWVRPVVFALVPIALFTSYVNFALATRYQREWSYSLEPHVIAGFVGFQRDVNHALGGDPIDFDRTEAGLPDGVEHPGRLVVVGDCAALYVSDGLGLNAIKRSPWNAVESTEAAGHFSLRGAFPRRPVGTRVPIFSNGDPDDPNILFAEYRPDDKIVFEFRTPRESESRRYVPIPVEYDREYEIDVAADWRVDLLRVSLDDVGVLDTFYRYEGDDFRIGRTRPVHGVEARFPGGLTRRAPGAPLCNALVRDAADRE